MVEKKIIEDLVDIKKLLGKLDNDITLFKTDIEKTDILIDYMLQHLETKLKKEQLKKENPEMTFEEEEDEEYD